MTQFDHDKLDVYHAAIDFLGIADEVINQLPDGRPHFKTQLGKASLSISCNTAEGAGEYKPKAKANFYRIACRSATECAAILDACKKLQLADEERLAHGRELLLRIVSMLTKLAQRHQKQRRR